MSACYNEPSSSPSFLCTMALLHDRARSELLASATHSTGKIHWYWTWAATWQEPVFSIAARLGTLNFAW